MGANGITGELQPEHSRDGGRKCPDAKEFGAKKSGAAKPDAVKPDAVKKVQSIATMPDLKLIAFDHDDLAVVSTHLQDAVLRVADMAFLPREQRFAAVVNRFDWDDLLASGGQPSKQTVRRRRAGLRFERVRDAKVQGINLKDGRATLALLAISFEPHAAAAASSAADASPSGTHASETDGPEGYVTLTFSGGAAIRLSVECIEAELKDLGAVWATARVPEHPDDVA